MSGIAILANEGGGLSASVRFVNSVEELKAAIVDEVEMTVVAFIPLNEKKASIRAFISLVELDVETYSPSDPNIALETMIEEIFEAGRASASK